MLPQSKNFNVGMGSGSIGASSMPTRAGQGMGPGSGYPGVGSAGTLASQGGGLQVPNN